MRLASMAAPKIAISLPTMPAPGAEPMNVVRIARHVEQLGFESVWVADLQTGDGNVPSLEAVTTLAVLAGATERIGLGFGTLVLPLRRVPLLAAQLATLQRLSGDRVLLGVGSGGFPDTPFWQALGVPGRERGRRTDDALRLLPGLVAGEPTTVDGVKLTMLPAATMPPVLIGGNSDVAIRRTVAHGDGWMPSLISPDLLATRVRALRAAAGSRPVSVTVGGHMFVGSGSAVDQQRAEFVRQLVDLHGLPEAEAERAPMPGASASVIADRFAAYAAAGADRICVGPHAETEDEFLRHCDLIAEAASRTGSAQRR
jgi:alkanesulfonate monooxygenase SsuD/methylene tetrahydromethanopterin reductase-like flavin-dependent oxidoreductase (luciferase family)